MLTKYIRPHFGSHTKAADVAFADIDGLHRKISKAGFPYRAKRILAVLSKMFSLAERWQIRDANSNPCRGVERNHESKRKRYLSGDELGRLVTALAAHPDKEAERQPQDRGDVHALGGRRSQHRNLDQAGR
jgi:hypothetical protein